MILKSGAMYYMECKTNIFHTKFTKLELINLNISDKIKLTFKILSAQFLYKKGGKLMLKLKNITKDYETGEEKVRALKGINLEFRENEFVSILGQSGCGKTTLLNIIGGLDQYTSGELSINRKINKRL